MGGRSSIVPKCCNGSLILFVSLTFFFEPFGLPTTTAAMFAGNLPRTLSILTPGVVEASLPPSVCRGVCSVFLKMSLPPMGVTWSLLLPLLYCFSSYLFPLVRNVDISVSTSCLEMMLSLVVLTLAVFFSCKKQAISRIRARGGFYLRRPIVDFQCNVFRASLVLFLLMLLCRFCR